MSPAAVVAVIFIVVFVIGVVVGIIAVVAMAAVRADRRSAAEREPGSDDLLERNRGAYGIPGHWDSALTDDPDPDLRPRWPGGGENAK